MYQEGLTEHDYAPLIGMPKKRRALPKNVPTEKDLAVLLESITPTACTEHGRSVPLTVRDRCMLELLYATGIRNEELWFTLLSADVLFESRTTKFDMEPAIFQE